MTGLAANAIRVQGCRDNRLTSDTYHFLCFMRINIGLEGKASEVRGVQ